ncbi:GLPGLI family protein [Kordia sp.]|uniref:GLPGLI family protein n=1 Tax=Kordia sp. TaxID=1965332 RepID=UPI003D28ABB2
MKNLLLLISLLFVNSFMLAQNTTKGKVEYTMVLNMGKQKINNASLVFDKNESFFFWNYKIQKDSTSIDEKTDDENNMNLKIKFNKAIYTDSIGVFNYKNFKQRDLINRVFLSKKLYYIKEAVPVINWEIKEETKKIANFECQKAITRFRGRSYTAWFTNKIPISDGPWKFHGLPGLILEVTDATNEIAFFFKSLEIPTKAKTPNIDFPNLNYITLDAFKKDRDLYVNSLFNAKKTEKKFKSKLPRNVSVDVQVDRKIKYIELDTEN